MHPSFVHERTPTIFNKTYYSSMLLKMTTNDSAEETPLKDSNFEQEGDEDEALSLSDLPLNLISEDDDHQIQSGKESGFQVVESEEEFNFGSWGGSLSTESEMCAADDVFFKGQILPLRLSVSSDSGLTKFQHHSRKPAGRCLFRSESMDCGSSSSLGGLTSVDSSRSSSTSSHYSSSSNSSFNTTTTTNNSSRNSKPRMRNQFHTYPSPKPQIRISNSRLGRNSSGSRSQITSKWDLFRLGLVRAPEIELQDLKLRNNNNIASRSSVSRNSSSGSSSSSVKNKQELETGKQQNKNKKQSFLDKNLGLFSGCKCSISAVETVPLNNIVIIKSETDESTGGKNINESCSAVHATEKKVQQLKIKKKMKEKQQGKQAMSRHRTFEWLKELSHASYVDGNLVVD